MSRQLSITMSERESDLALVVQQRNTYFIRLFLDSLKSIVYNWRALQAASNLISSPDEHMEELCASIVRPDIYVRNRNWDHLCGDVWCGYIAANFVSQVKIVFFYHLWNENHLPFALSRQVALWLLQQGFLGMFINTSNDVYSGVKSRVLWMCAKCHVGGAGSAVVDQFKDVQIYFSTRQEKCWWPLTHIEE